MNPNTLSLRRLVRENSSAVDVLMQLSVWFSKSLVSAFLCIAFCICILGPNDIG